MDEKITELERDTVWMRVFSNSMRNRKRDLDIASAVASTSDSNIARLNNRRRTTASYRAGEDAGVTAVPHTGQRSGVARRSYPQVLQQPTSC